MPTPRIHFIHDWLTGLRGGEKVLLNLIHLFPNSTISTLLHIKRTTHPDIDARVTQTSFLQNLPNIAATYRNYLPLFPRAIRSLKVPPNCDLILSVSHAVAKGIIPPPNIPHLCYCNTPMRYIWGIGGGEDHYLPRASLKRLALAAVKPALRRFDLKNNHVTQFIANSHTVQTRIQKIYHRDSTVIHPGIDETPYTLSEKPRENFYLIAGAFVPYKRIDLAIKTFRNLPNENLKIIGTGPEEKKLKLLAKNSPNITFLGHQPDASLIHHYQTARAFLFPGEDDFGLTPLEAQACGTPVIAYHAGGACETVTNDTGLFFHDQTPESLAAALQKFPTLTFNPPTLRQNALRFTWSHFQTQMLQAVESVLANRI